MARVAIGSVDLSPRKASWFRVVCALNEESRRVRAAKIIEGHFPRFLEVYTLEIDYLARVYGVSWEQMYALLDSERAQPYTTEDLEWAKTANFTVFREEEAKNKSKLGIELSPQLFAERSPERLSLDAIVALEQGMRSAFNDGVKPPEPGDLSAWATGYRMGLTMKTELIKGGQDDSNARED